jgi:hypothetical protein
MEIITRSNAKDKDIRDYQNAILELAHQSHFTDELTVEMLKEMKPHTIFAYGFIRIEHPWFNDANNVDRDGRSTLVKYVALRGGIEDWAIYHSMDLNLVGYEGLNYFNGTSHLFSSNERIASFGAKLRDERVIRDVITCTEDALDLYRF